jgi:DNA-binding CsgD family transcriptional regulator
MGTLSTADLERVVAFVGELHAFDGPEPYSPELLDLMKNVLPSDAITFCELDHSRLAVITAVDATGDRAADPDDFGPDGFASCWRNPMSVYRRRSGDRAPIKFSDFMTRRERMAHPDIADDSREWDLQDELWVDIGPSHVRTRKFLLTRGSRDFGERERAIAALLQPHLESAYGNAERRRLLAAALAAAEAAQGAVVLVGTAGETEWVSPAAHDLIERWFGSNGRLPEPLVTWHSAGPREPFVRERAGRRLVVELAGRRDALLLREETGEPLTPRERDVLLLVAQGKSNKEIALDLWVTPATVKKHLEHVYYKLGVTNRTAAVAALGG